MGFMCGDRPAALGIDTARLVEEAGACLQAIETLGPDRLREFNVTTIPTVHEAEPGA